MHTKILNVLVGGEAKKATGVLGADLLAGAPCLVNDYAVGKGCGNEGKTVGKLGHPTVVVKGDVGERVTGDAQKEDEVPVEFIMLASLPTPHSVFLWEARMPGRRLAYDYSWHWEVTCGSRNIKWL